jgi:hypothetical protein
MEKLGSFRPKYFGYTVYSLACTSGGEADAGGGWPAS